MKKGCLLIIAMTMYGYIFSQSITVQESSQFQHTLSDFFEGTDKNFENYPLKDQQKAISEIIICLFSIDSSGKVASIHLLADDTKRGSAFERLSNLTPAQFSEWQCKSCKGKTILVPMSSQIPGSGSKYLERLSQPQVFKHGESANCIIFPAMVWGPLIAKD